MNLYAPRGAWSLWRILSYPYLAAVHMRRYCYRRGLMRTHHVDVPVISVGGVTVGGSGKTPAVIWLLEQIAKLGLKPAVVSRGYGGNPGSEPYVVCDGHIARADVHKCGDEPALISWKSPESIIVVHPDRVDACARAIELGADLIVVDDGLQHKRLARDLDIVLVDARQPFGNGCFLPAGPLRDTPQAMATAGLVLLTRAEGASERELEQSMELAAQLAPEAALACVRYELSSPTDLSGKKVFAFSGIARPDTFVASLEHMGVDVIGNRAFPDHHRYTDSDLKLVRTEAANADVIVTTEKDATRLPNGGFEIVPVALQLNVDGVATTYIHNRLHAWFPLQHQGGGAE